MITTGDARNILFSACKGVGIKDMHTSWAIPEGKVDRERIVVITPPEQTPGHVLGKLLCCCKPVRPRHQRGSEPKTAGRTRTGSQGEVQGMDVRHLRRIRIQVQV